MPAEGRNWNRIVAGAVIALVLVTALGWLWGAKKTRQLESSARGSIAASTARLQEALALSPETPDAQAKLEASLKEIGESLAALRREDGKRNRPLADAAEVYLVDAQAILRNQANAVRWRGTALAGRRALAAHMANAAGRGPGWIQQALALKTRAERDYFEVRNALGTYAELLRVHRDTQEKVHAVLPEAKLLEPAALDAAYKRAKDAEQQAAAELERVRQMAIPH